MQVIEKRRKSGVLVLRLEGRLESTTARPTQTKLQELTDDRVTTAILDLAQLEFVSSAGLRVLLVTAQRMKGHGAELLLCSPRKHILNVLELSGFSSLLHIFDTYDEALGSIGLSRAVLDAD